MCYDYIYEFFFEILTSKVNEILVLSVDGFDETLILDFVFR